MGDRQIVNFNLVWTISYIISHTGLKANKTDAVTVCLFRIFTIEQIILNPVTVAKHLVVLTVLEESCVVIFAHRDQILQRATMLEEWPVAMSA